MEASAGSACCSGSLRVVVLVFMLQVDVSTEATEGADTPCADAGAA